MKKSLILLLIISLFLTLNCNSKKTKSTTPQKTGKNPKKEETKPPKKEESEPPKKDIQASGKINPQKFKFKTIEEIGIPMFALYLDIKSLRKNKTIASKIQKEIYSQINKENKKLPETCSNFYQKLIKSIDNISFFGLNQKSAVLIMNFSEIPEKFLYCIKASDGNKSEYTEVNNIKGLKSKDASMFLLNKKTVIFISDNMMNKVIPGKGELGKGSIKYFDNIKGNLKFTGLFKGNFFAEKDSPVRSFYTLFVILTGHSDETSLSRHCLADVEHKETAQALVAIYNLSINSPKALSELKKEGIDPSILKHLKVSLKGSIISTSLKYNINDMADLIVKIQNAAKKKKEKEKEKKKESKN